MLDGKILCTIKEAGCGKKVVPSSTSFDRMRKIILPNKEKMC